MTLVRGVIASLFALVVSACTTFRTPVSLNAAAPAATSFHSLSVGRDTRTFLLHLPPAAATHRVPLVIVFHGHTGNAAVAEQSSQMNVVADSAGVAIVYANGSGRVRGVGLSWNAGNCCGWAQKHGVDDLAFVDSLQSTLARSQRIDTTEIFAAGFSAGGMLALKVACERPGMVRGVADLAGAMPNFPCDATQPVGILLMRGDDDDDLREDHAIQTSEGAPPYATSLDSTAAFWERVNRCTGHDVREVTLAARDQLRTRTATGCAPGGAVEIVSIPDHPHAWPGGKRTWWFGQRPTAAVNGSAVVLKFFASLIH